MPFNTVPRQQGLGRLNQLSPGANPEVQQQLVQLLLQLLSMLQSPRQALGGSASPAMAAPRAAPMAQAQMAAPRRALPSRAASPPQQGAPGLPQGIQGRAQGRIGTQGVGGGNASQGLPLLMDLIARMSQGGAR